jgi:hypothetical protein
MESFVVNSFILRFRRTIGLSEDLMMDFGGCRLDVKKLEELVNKLDELFVKMVGLEHKKDRKVIGMMTKCKDKGLCKVAKLVDKVLVSCVKAELEGKTVRWKERIGRLIWQRIRFIRWREEKWLGGILAECEYNLDEEMMEEKGLVYVIFNLGNRKRYVGETLQTLRKRYSGHFGETKRNKWRRKVKMMMNIGFENLIVMPVR